MGSFITPPPLSPGCTVAIVAPASSPTQSDLEAGIASLESVGCRVKSYRPLTQPHGYLSGADEHRAAELMQAFHDSEVQAIIAARGGYGLARILDRLDFAAIRDNPKAVIGYSDITALHAAICKHSRLVTYHAPNAVDGLAGGGKLDQFSIDAFWRVVSLEPGKHRLDLPTDCRLHTLAPGSATGRLIGGNLAVLCGLLGTRFEPDFDGAILFLEDIGEASYRVDRMLSQLALSGNLSRVAGVLLGDFTDCGALSNGPSLSLSEVLEGYLKPLGAPVLVGFPAGHSVPNLTLPHGATVTLNADLQEVWIEK